VYGFVPLVDQSRFDLQCSVAFTYEETPMMQGLTMIEQTNGAYTISTDPDRLDLDRICAFLAQAYWAQGRTRAAIERSLRHSLCFGLYRDGMQVGLARVISDYATYAYLCDVFLVEAERGHGLGKWLIETVVNHPDLLGLRRFMLATRDAHGLYQHYGFVALQAPERWMERIAL
jgi:GNAT superfamily N-acetyltransferase